MRKPPKVDSLLHRVCWLLKRAWWLIDTPYDRLAHKMAHMRRRGYFHNIPEEYFRRMIRYLLNAGNGPTTQKTLFSFLLGVQRDLAPKHKDEHSVEKQGSHDFGEPVPKVTEEVIAQLALLKRQVEVIESHEKITKLTFLSVVVAKHKINARVYACLVMMILAVTGYFVAMGGDLAGIVFLFSGEFITHFEIVVPLALGLAFLFDASIVYFRMRRGCYGSNAIEAREIIEYVMSHSGSGISGGGGGALQPLAIEPVAASDWHGVPGAVRGPGR
ncbi:hypothetical protein [Azospirillum sp. Marseille-Q6669]